MGSERLRYPKGHWLRSEDPQKALDAYMEQQSKAYSQVKNDYVAELLGDLKGKRFLDYGCGAGLFTTYAADSGASVAVGIDAERTALAAARLFARRLGVETACKFYRAERFPQHPPETKFDVILLKDVLEHVEDDEQLLNCVARAITPDGTLVVSTQNSVSVNFVIEGAYQRLYRANKNWFGWDETHVRFYTPLSLARKLKAAGFTPVAWRSAYLVPYKLPALPGSGKQFFRLDQLARLDRTIGWLWPYNRLGWNVIVKAKAGPEIAEKIRKPVLRNRMAPAAMRLASPVVIGKSR